jgi:propionyl-CoA carboxylase alpha chain
MAAAARAPIRKLLVANRGEIARRVIRTARAMGIATVAVHSDPDAHAPHVAEADEAVRLPGAAASDTYLRVELIVAAALATGADAVHPGYGFLSEHAGFARACADAGLTFVGPPPDVIERMGSKVEAKRLMADAGVPVLPGHTVDPGTSDAALLEAARVVGYPLLVKASFGGGGRGMRTVTSEGELLVAVADAQREAVSAFGDGTVFLERLVVAPRHVEVQVFGDEHGTVVHLYERECSIQRRHQKVIEESPSPAVDAALRAELCGAAVTAAKAIGYVGAGTVEFVLEGDGRFWFLEVNTRLQVEHPVTEMVTGLDLVRVQLEVAAGAPLPAAVLDAPLDGHAIEARLYAEDVPAGFLPTTGTVHRFAVPTGAGIRVDAGVVDGTVVGTHYDAMLAKVVAWAPTRGEAAAKLAEALERAQLHGPVTNRPLLVRTLRHPEFLAGATDTGFLVRHDPAALGAPLADGAAHRVHALAAALALREVERAGSPVPVGIPHGWRNVGPAHQPVELGVAGDRLSVDGIPPGTRVVAVGPDLVELEVDGVRRRCTVHHVVPGSAIDGRGAVPMGSGVGGTWWVDSALGSSELVVVPRFAPPVRAVAVGSLLAPLPGAVVQVLVAVGDVVAAGQPVVTIEAMKMQHTVHAPHAGPVTAVHVAVGDQVEAAGVLLVVDELDGEVLDSEASNAVVR